MFINMALNLLSKETTILDITVAPWLTANLHSG
jgi:hypothetical protein